MRTGASISAVGHAVILFLVMFGGFEQNRLIQPEIEATTVAIISDAEFRALQLDQVDTSEEEAAPVVEELTDILPPALLPEVADVVVSDEPQPPPVESPPPVEPEHATDTAVETASVLPPPLPVEPIISEPVENPEPVVETVVLPEGREVASLSDTETQVEEAARQAAEKIFEEVAPEPKIDGSEIETEVEETTPDESSDRPIVETLASAEQEEAVIETVTEVEETEATATELTRPLRRPPQLVVVPAVPDIPEETTLAVLESVDQTPPEPEPDSPPEIEPEPAPEPELDPPTEPEPDIPLEPEPDIPLEPEPDIPLEPEPTLPIVVEEPEPLSEPVQSEDEIAAMIMQAILEKELADVATTQLESDGLAAQLTAGERDGLKRAIQNCWNFSSLSDAAKRITVTIAAELERNGRPVQGSIKLVEATEGSQDAKKRAFEAGQRAILRCLNQGYSMPPEKYESWRRIEIVFNPEEMRNR